MNSKYTSVLTMLLVVFIVVILGIMAYFVYDAFYSQKIESDAQAALDKFEQSTQAVRPNTEKKENIVKNETTNTITEEPENVVNNETTTDFNQDDALNQLAQFNQTPQTNPDNQPSEPEKVYMEEYEIKGSIKIPKTNVEYPILENVTKRSLEIAVGIAYPRNANLNEVGNVVIYGHNYRNGKFFSNNKKLSNGDDIYITDQYGSTVVYEIYNIYETDANDAEFFKRDTEGRREISLQTCTDDGARRIIIWAAEK